MHDISQGLTYFNGLLYESTGKYGQSKVRILDPHTGQVLKTAKMSNTYFCEGLAYVHDRKNDSDKAIIDDVNAFVGDALVQLTWKAQTGFVYHPETLELLYEFKYNTETAQGWGITYLPDTQELVVSDGSQYLHYWNATNIRQPRKYFDESRERVPVSVAVKNGAHDYNPVPMDQLNELEYVRGWILANVWQSNDILKIHPVTGMVVEVLDMTDLYPLEERAPSANVLNGISIVQDGDELAASGGDGMDSDSIEVFVTGKQWPSIFRIKVHHLEGLRLPPQLVDTDVESGVVVDKTAVSDATPSSLEKMMECPATGDCYHVLSTLDHDPSSFTQGLSYADGILYESTGLYGYSKVRRLDPHTGEVMASFDLEKQFFGEGMTYQKTIHNNKSEELVQITWKAQLGIVYDALSLKEIRRFPYKTHTNQGWGITYMPHVNELVVSDGSEWLHFWNATAGDASEEYAYKELRRIQVRHPSAEGDADADSVVTKTTPPQAQAGKVVDQLNELEYMESSNLILANIWYKNIIVAIDPQSGEVARTYDLNQLWPMNQRPPTADCLNGISVTDQPGQLFVTGKKWPTIYRIQMLDRLS
jgi:glutamine cyclotransferase